METEPANSFVKAARLFYFIAVISYTICLAFFLPDNLVYERWGIIRIDSLTSVLVYLSLFLHLRKILAFKTAASIYVYSALLNIIFSSWVYYFTLSDPSGLILICTSIYSINMAIAGLCIGYKHAYLAAFLYLASIGPIMIISGGSLLHQYGIIICLLMVAFAAGISGFLYILEKNYKRELSLKENQRDLAIEHEKLLKSQLEFKQREILTKSMFLAEHAKNNNNLIQKLTSFKSNLKTDDQKRVDTIICSNRMTPQSEYWRDFEISFVEVKHDFVGKLKSTFPQLSSAEIRLASLVHLGLSSKQIARLTSNTPESIDVARSRLRAKLNLASNINLRTFLDLL